MTQPITYQAEAAHSLLKKKQLKNLTPDLLAARDTVFADVDLRTSGEKIPKKKQPLDSGFIPLPQQLLDEYHGDADGSLLGRIIATAGRMRESVDRVVSLGIGGSYMGARALLEALCDPWHNQKNREQRGNIPRIIFEGNNVENDSIHSLLELLNGAGLDAARIEDRWGLIVISKSGGTLETALAFRIFREALEKFYGGDSDEARQLVVPVTGETGRLRDFANHRGYPDVFPIPDGVGGRFSVFTAVGLLPAAVLGIDVVELLQGAADMTERFRTAEYGENPVLDYTATCHLLEKHHGMNIRVLSTWGGRLEAFGLWYDQLLSESLGKKEQGATPITVVNTRDLHSRGQQHQEGMRDKVITNVVVDSPATAPLQVPIVAAEENQDDLNRLEGKTVPDVLAAAFEGTNQAYAADDRPTADLRVPRLNAHSMGQLLQMFMLATALEGRLIGINPYGQPGVEGYKVNMNEILNRR